MNDKNLCEVFAWGEKIAILLEHNGIIYYEAKSDNALLFSPLKLKNKKTTTYPDLSFQSFLPGLISDHLPGSYGDKYMNAFFKKKQNKMPSTLEKLLFIGEHSIGALEFKPSIQSNIKGQILELKDMHKLSKDALRGEHDFELATLIAVSNSAGGGARAKAHVGFNADNEKLYVADKHASLPKDFEHAIVKFDENHEGTSIYIPREFAQKSVYTKTEYAYSLIAKKLGINMSDCYIVDTEQGAHFVTKRFDYENNERKHLHSLSGLLHVDAAQQFATGYEDIFEVAIALKTPVHAFEQIFKTMVFNMVFGNRDDHAKNFSFIMNKKKEWDFSPSYDLTYIINRGASSEHQLSIGGQPASWACLTELEVIASKFGIKDYKSIILNTIDAKHELLRSTLSPLDVPSNWINDIFANTKEIDINLKKES